MAITFGPLQAGPFTGLYNSLAIGFTIEGWKWGYETKEQAIDKTDIFGDTLIDTIFRGVNAKVSYKSRVYNTNNLGPISPWGPPGTIYTAAAPIARNARSVAKAFALAAVANTASTIVSLVANLTLLANGTNTELMFDSSAMEIPVTLQMYPYESAAGTLVNAVLT